MRKNNKGFSLVELLGVMVILGILISSSVIAYSRYRKSARIQSYDTMASSAADAAAQYAMDYPGTKDVTLEDLYEGQYLSSLSDPGKKDKTCRGRVSIQTQSTGNTSELDTQSYSVHICCKNYNYSYKYPEGDKIKDSYCNADPYDITKITEIKVLNIYPEEAYKNNFPSWMANYGKDKIKVDTVYINDFNNNYNKYLNDDKKYDILVFGFADCNGSKDLTAESAKAVDKFLNAGGAAIFGHDTITTGCGNHKYFITLSKYVNIQATSDLNWAPSSDVTIQRSGVFTEYPWSIGKIGTKLKIPTSHVYGQVAGGDVWLTFDNIGTPAKSIYLSTYGNNAFIQTGHSNGSATEDEQKIIANIIFYTMSQRYS